MLFGRTLQVPSAIRSIMASAKPPTILATPPPKKVELLHSFCWRILIYIACASIWVEMPNLILLLKIQKILSSYCRLPSAMEATAVIFTVHPKRAIISCWRFTIIDLLKTFSGEACAVPVSGVIGQGCKYFWCSGLDSGKKAWRCVHVVKMCRLPGTSTLPPSLIGTCSESLF